MEEMESIVITVCPSRFVAGILNEISDSRQIASIMCHLSKMQKSGNCGSKTVTVSSQEVGADQEDKLPSGY